jgi:uncharacterized protein (TIGR03083 family)
LSVDERHVGGDAFCVAREATTYASRVDLWVATIGARRSLLETFEQLDDDQWRVQSLSEGWAVREVLAHLILAARPPARRYTSAVIRARGSFDKANHALAVADARRPVHELLSDYRGVLEHRFSPPGWPPAAPLSDVLLHSLDVRVPLGLPTDQAASDYVSVMDLLFSRVGRSFTRRDRPSLHWVATDDDWSHGDGHEVRGALADLALTAAGRSARIECLSGNGVQAIRNWLD